MRKTSLAIFEYYHLYSRGVDKRVIFLDESDYNRFEALLFLCNQKESIEIRNIKPEDYFNPEKRGDPIVAIGAWCLMPNHIHIFAKEITEGGITMYLKKVLTAYSMYFNKKYKRSGALFESRFKSEHIDTDEYMRYMPVYIHLNPLSIKFPEWKKSFVNPVDAITFLGAFKHSSLRDYKEGAKRKEGLIISKDSFPVYHFSYDTMIKEYIEWIDIKNDLYTEVGPPYKKTQ